MPRQYLPINNGIMCLNDVICACLLLEQKKKEEASALSLERMLSVIGSKSVIIR